MDFKKWIKTEERVDRLLCRLIEHRVSICGIANDLLLREDAGKAKSGGGLLAFLRDRFRTLKKRMGEVWEDEKKDKSSPVYWVRRAMGYKDGQPTPPPQGEPAEKKDDKGASATQQPYRYTATPEQMLQNLNDFYEKLMSQWQPRDAKCSRGFDGRVWCKAPWKDVDPEDGTPGNPYTYGYVPKEEYERDFEQMKKDAIERINQLQDELGVKTRKNSPESFEPSPEEVKAKVEKAKEAVGTLRSILTDPKHQDLLRHLEKEVAMLGKPDHYHQMTDGEKAWYDKLDDTQRKSFDDEMGKSGKQYLTQGDAETGKWWDVAAQRAQKAASQGYQDADANWRWAADFANRQRIRSAMNPDWANQLQGEALTPGGKMFREWLKRRVTEQAAGDSGVAADAPGEVTAPSDPKEIARRKAVSKFAGTIMKKNPKLKPGATDQNTVANLAASDPELSKADPETQQAVSNFFLKK